MSLRSLVDAFITQAGADFKALRRQAVPDVVVATTGAITLSGTQTVDGYAAGVGELVLVKDQPNYADNGPYVVSAGAWPRYAPFNTAVNLAGLIIRVQKGAVNGGRSFRTTFKSSDTLGTTPMPWRRTTAVTPTELINTAKNPSATVDVTGWSSFINAETTIARTTAWSNDGVAAFRLTKITDSTGHVGAVIQGELASGLATARLCSAGQIVKMQAVVHNPNATAKDVYLTQLFYNVTPAQILQITSPVTTIAAGGTATLQFTAIAPAATLYNHVAVYAYNTGTSDFTNAELLDVDQVMILVLDEDIEFPSYFDGGSTGGWWTGVTDISYSAKFFASDVLSRYGVNAKGDILAASADNTIARKAVGVNGQALLADSSQSDGLIWATPDARIFPVVVASVSNLTLSGTQTVNGVAVGVDDAVLVMAQTSGGENGVLVCKSGAWIRHPAFDTAAKCAGAIVRAISGTVDGGYVWFSGFKSTDTLGTTAMVWASPYSDLNPPETLTMTEFASGSVATPASGKATLSTADGSQVLIKDDAGTQRVVGEIVGEQALTTEYASTTPAVPSSGIKFFARNRARRLPSFIGPTGQDSQLQPAVFSNRVCQYRAVNGINPSGTEGIQNDNLVTAVAGTAAPVTAASTNFFTSMVRASAATTAVAGTGAGLRTNSQNWFLSSTANMGGVFFVARLGLNTVQVNTRAFVGMSATNAALNPAVDPSTLFNLFGFGFDAADTNWQFMYNDASGAATKVDLGANFPAHASAATYFYEFRLYVPSGAGQSVRWSAHRLNDGIVVTDSGAVVANLPALGTLLGGHIHYSNGVNAAIHSIHFQTLYLESDN